MSLDFTGLFGSPLIAQHYMGHILTQPCRNRVVVLGLSRDEHGDDQIP